MSRERAEAPQALRRPQQPGRGRAIVLAVIVHVLFFALIVFGVRWQSHPTAPISAELWDKLPPAKPAANPPPAPKPKPEPKPQPKPAPEPQPKPEPAKPQNFGPIAPQQAKPAPLPDAAQIAAEAEREKQAREERERLEHERQQAEEKKRQREAAAAKKRAQEEAAQKKREQEQAAKKKREQEEAARKQREEEKRLAEERAKAESAERARQAAATARQMEIQSWVDKIKTKILSRANVPDTVATGTELNVRIRILPGGDVLSIQVTRSTNPTYSAAIERAIRSAQPLPVPPANSDLFPEFRDLNLNFRHER